MSYYVRNKNNSNHYLTTLSPKDKPWDTHKFQADQVASVYGETVYDRFKGRLEQCSGLLGFRWVVESDTQTQRLKLFESRFCRARHCPICQWRRSLLWLARFYHALPAIQIQHPTARWLFLTLTVKNIPVDQLRSTLGLMNKGWQRLIQRQDWSALGFVRSTEVTRGKNGWAHPHFHALLMVPSSYFNGRCYVRQTQWVERWQHVMRLEYVPVVDVRAVRPNGLKGAVPEVLKYSVKPDDMLGDAKWLEELTRQLAKLRFIASGGILKHVLREAEETNEALIQVNEDGEIQGMETGPALFFDWKRPLRRYVRSMDLS